MDKSNIRVFTHGQRLGTGKSVPHYAGGTIHYIGAHFDLDESWEGYDSVRAVWWNGAVEKATVFDATMTCTIPLEVVAKKGDVMVNLIASVSENGVLTDRFTSYPLKVAVIDAHARLTGSETVPVTPSQFEQFVENVKDEADRAKSEADRAEVIADGVVERAKVEADRAEQGATASAASASASAQSASESASSATASEQSASQASGYAQDASESAQSAENYAQDAEDARDEIRAMRAEAITLPAGSEATASYADGLLSLGIPRGSKGDTGDKGETGATPNITIGTVETLEPTEDATATITGTAENPVLNLGIPQGDTGEVTQAEFDVLSADVTDLKSAIKNADDNIERIVDTQLCYEYYDFTLGNIQSGTHQGAPDRCYTEALPLDKDIKVYFDDSQYRCLFVYLKDDETTAVVAGFVGTSPCTVNAGVSITTYPKFRIEIATKTAPTIDIEDVALSTYQVQDTNIASRQYVSDLVTGATSSVTVGQTGDYADLRACFAAITPSKLTPYNVYIQAGEYDIRSLFSATERAQSGFRGLSVPDYVTLIGLGGKDTTKLVWDGTNDTASTSIATLNFKNVVSLQGLTVVGKNIRYTIHDDFAIGNARNIRHIKDSEFVGEALTLNAIYGSGTGSNGGADWEFENCVFRGTNLICFMQHGVPNVNKSSYTLFRNCRFYGARGNEMQLASYNTGVTALNYVYLQGCKFSTALGTLGEIYMNEAQGQGIKYKILGCGNILDKVTINASDGVDYSSYVDLI